MDKDAREGSHARVRVGRWPFRVAAGWAALTTVAVLYLLDPTGVGQIARAVLMGACFLTMAVCAVTRRFDPPRILHVAGVGGLILFPSVLDPWTRWQGGPFTVADLSLLFGSLTLTCWLVMLVTSSGANRSWETVLDTGAASNGAVIACWVLLIGPWAHAADHGPLVVVTLSPIFGAMLLAAAGLLAVRLRRVPPPLWWVIGAATVWLFVDLLRLLAHHDIVSVAPNAVDVLALVPPLMFALVACHPRLQELMPTLAAPARPTAARWGPRVVTVAAIVAPVVLAIGIPDLSTFDRGLRMVTVTTLFIMLFGRIAYMVYALAGAERESRERAVREPLTGLYNRGALVEALETRLQCDTAAGAYTVLIFLDCDDFKRVNDTWGHRAGDVLLVDVADRLRGVAAPADMVARHGGDEFVVLSSVTDLSEGEALAERVMRAFDEPLSIGQGRTHPLSPSVGAAFVAPGRDSTGEELLSRADEAMYTAKRRGKGRVVFAAEHAAETLNRRSIDPGGRALPA